MRTIISGAIDDQALDQADLIGGITPTCFVTNGLWEPPFSVLPEKVYPVEIKLGRLGETARNYTLCQNADALILADDNPHLLRVAQQYGLVVFEA